MNEFFTDSERPRTIVVLADDLSGAAEMAGIAVAHGLSVEVQRHELVVGSSQCILVDTDTRLLPAEQAANKVFRLAQQITSRFDSHPFVFKKIDSVLRGPVRAEIETMLHALEFRQALVIAANPSRGRTIERGQYFVAGVPLERTAFAQDPEFPRRTSRVLDLLGYDGTTELRSLSAKEDIHFEQIAVPDVQTPDDVQQRARVLTSDTLAVGAADFFAAILSERFGLKRCEGFSALSNAMPEPKLLVCGSHAAWPMRREQCRVAGIESRTSRSALHPSFRRLALAIEPADGTQHSPAELLRELAVVAARLIEQHQPRTLLLEGGATAAAIAERLGWQTFAVNGVTADGLARLRPMGAAHQCGVLVKPGSYAWPDDVWRQFCD